MTLIAIKQGQKWVTPVDPFNSQNNLDATHI